MKLARLLLPALLLLPFSSALADPVDVGVVRAVGNSSAFEATLGVGEQINLDFTLNADTNISTFSVDIQRENFGLLREFSAVLRT
jgi:hypothetical protein